VVGETGRDAEEVSRFVERFASAVIAAGVPRMPARVFSALLSSDSGRMTAAELADLLQVSPAAISGAVRYLEQIDMARRERDPGSRRDHFRISSDVWYEVIAKRDQVLLRWADAAREGIEVLGWDTPAGARMADSVAFFEFVMRELPALVERWQQSRPAR